MTQNDDVVLMHDEGAVRTITLNRPDTLNAFSEELLVGLGKAVKAAAKDMDVRCVVITGAGRAFCSGQDLAEVKKRYHSNEPIELGRHLRRLYNPMVVQIRSMEKPVLASVNGVAAGAGCSLALVCDMRVAAESSSFIQSFIHVGVIPDSGGTFMLPRLIGLSRAMELAFTGRKVTAAEAERIGLVNRVVPDAALAEETVKLASQLASLPTRGIGLAKRALNAAWCSDLETQLDYEAMLQTTAGQSCDHREGVAAFLEKRRPAFTGE